MPVIVKKSVDVCRRYIVRHQHRFSGHTVYTVLNVVMGVMGYVQQLPKFSFCCVVEFNGCIPLPWQQRCNLLFLQCSLSVSKKMSTWLSFGFCCVQLSINKICCCNYRVGQKVRPQPLGYNSVKSQPISKLFTILGKLAVRWLLKTQTHLTHVGTLHCTTLMSENKRLAIHYKVVQLHI